MCDGYGKNRLPTDRAILEDIYREYCGEFSAYSEQNPNRGTKIYVPIDIEAISARLGTDGDIVFGRLYYDLDRRHGYTEDGAKVHLFTLKVGADRHCVNFPFLASVLARLREDHGRYIWSLRLSIAAFVVSVVSLAASAFG